MYSKNIQQMVNNNPFIQKINADIRKAQAPKRKKEKSPKFSVAPQTESREKNMETEVFAVMTMWQEGKTKGGYWSKVKNDLTTQELSREQYKNIVEHPWKGDRMTYGYTDKGYLVTRMTTRNPHAEERSVREFNFKKGGN